MTVASAPGLSQCGSVLLDTTACAAARGVSSLLVLLIIALQGSDCIYLLRRDPDVLLLCALRRLVRQLFSEWEEDEALKCKVLT